MQLQEAGVKCVIEPGGSIRDDEIIEAANEYGMALYFSELDTLTLEKIILNKH